MTRYYTFLEMCLILSVIFGNSFASDCGCGERNIDREIELKVIKGEEADVNEFPWAALLKIRNVTDVRSGYAVCGGTLINDR